MSIGVTVVVGVMLASPAPALEVLLRHSPHPVERVEQGYDCSDGRSFVVSYLRSGPVALAILATPRNETLVLANVVSASGSRYVASRYEWWVKGDEATLTVGAGASEASSIECHAV